MFIIIFFLGNHQGEILLFNISPNGTNIFLKETIPGKINTKYLLIHEKVLSIKGHQHGITGLVANDEVLVSSDTNGTILIWNIRTMLQVNVIEPADNSGITSLSLWKNCIIAGYANGMIRFFDAMNGK